MQIPTMIRFTAAALALAATPLAAQSAVHRRMGGVVASPGRGLRPGRSALQSRGLLPAQLLAAAAERPAPAGHERLFMRWLRRQLPGPRPVSDNLHNLIYRFGPNPPGPAAPLDAASRQAPLLIVAEVDQPDFLVSRIQRDGDLQLQGMRSSAPTPPGYAQYFFAAPLTLLRPGRNAWSPLTAAGYGPSIHLLTRRRWRRIESQFHVSHLYVTTGAVSRAAARRAGVHRLEPVLIQPQLFAAPGSAYWFGTLLSSRITLPVMERLLQSLAAHAPSRPVTVALATQGWFGHEGLRRLLLELHPAKVLYLGAGSGEVITAYASDTALGRAWGGMTAMPVTMALPPAAGHALTRVLAKTPSLVLRVPVRYRHTAAEMADLYTLRLFSRALVKFVRAQSGLAAALGRRTGGIVALPGRGAPGRIPSLAASGWTLPQAIAWPPKHAALPWPSPRQLTPAPAVVAPLLERVVQVAAVSNHEAPMRREVRRLIARFAPHARLHAGPAGTLWVGLGPHRGPAILFIAHMDEIGWEVSGVLPDGELALKPMGGFLPQLYSGRILLLHTAQGEVPGALHYLPARGRRRPLARLDVGLSGPALGAQGIALGDFVAVPKRFHPLLDERVMGRSLDDRVGCASLLAALRALSAGPPLRRRVIIAFSTGEELGLDGARALARLWVQREPATVFALDTFVSSDSPLESRRFAYAQLGRGFVIRAADNSLIAPHAMVSRILKLARAARIPVQTGVTGGGNDASAFIPYGSASIGLGWPMLSSHSPAEIADLRDVAALAGIVVVLAREWTQPR